MSASTVETKAKTKNNIKALIFCALSILLEIAVIMLMMTVLKNYAPIIQVIMLGLALVLALMIYSQDKTSSVKMPWIILMLISPVFGVTLYLLIGLNGGTKRMKMRYLAIDTILSKSFPKGHEVLVKELTEINPKAGSISHYLSKVARNPVYHNTDVTYFDDASKGLESQLTELAKAEKFIFMEYHAIENATAWKRIQDVLVDRVKNGVEVRVFYDDMGSVGFINDDFAKSLNALGIQCHVFNAFAPGLNVFLNNRDHRKITVIDGKVGFTGGYNLADEYFNLTHPFGRWKDTGVRLEGDAVASLTIFFLEMWSAASSDKITDVRAEKYLPQYDYKAQQKGFIQPYAFGPMYDERIGENVYISMVEKAEKYCWFITPYLVITDEMMHALRLAALRGVDVRIITPGIPDKKLVYSVTRSFYSRLADAGVRIFEWSPGFCHAKMCVVDDCMAVCGTINLDYRSLYHHFENGCFMAECDAVLDLRRDMEKTMEEAVEVTEICIQEAFSHLGLKGMLLRLFAELL